MNTDTNTNTNTHTNTKENKTVENRGVFVGFVISPVSVSVSFLLLDSASAGPWRMQTCVMRLRPYLLLATRRRPYSRPPRQAQLRTSSSSLRSPPRHTSSVKHAPSETKTHAPPSMLPLLLAMLRSFVTSFLSSSSSCRCPNAHTQR